MIPMYRLWLHGLYGLHGTQMSADPKKVVKLNHSLTPVHCMENAVKFTHSLLDDTESWEK